MGPMGNGAPQLEQMGASPPAAAAVKARRGFKNLQIRLKIYKKIFCCKVILSTLTFQGYIIKGGRNGDLKIQTKVQHPGLFFSPISIPLPTRRGSRCISQAVHWRKVSDADVGKKQLTLAHALTNILATALLEKLIFHPFKNEGSIDLTFRGAGHDTDSNPRKSQRAKIILTATRADLYKVV